MTIETVEDAHEYLVDFVGVSEETISVATYIEGYTMTAMESVLYVLTGCRSFDQLNDGE